MGKQIWSVCADGSNKLGENMQTNIGVQKQRWLHYADDSNKRGEDTPTNIEVPKQRWSDYAAGDSDNEFLDRFNTVEKFRVEGLISGEKCGMSIIRGLGRAQTSRGPSVVHEQRGHGW